MFAALDGCEKRVLPEIAKIKREAFQIIVRHILSGKGQDVVFQPGGADFSYLFIVKRFGQIYARNSGSAGLAGWRDDHWHHLLYLFRGCYFLAYPIFKLHKVHTKEPRISADSCFGGFSNIRSVICWNGKKIAPALISRTGRGNSCLNEKEPHFVYH